MKSGELSGQRQTTIVPVVTIEEVLVPTEQERADLLASLKEAEADVASGKAKPFDREEFKKRFFAICRGEVT